MKKTRFGSALAVLVLAFYLLGLATSALAANQKIELYLDGERVAEGSTAILSNGTVLLPMRQLFALFGLEVSWDGKEQSIEANVGDSRLRLVVGQKEAFIRHQAQEPWLPYEMSVPARLDNGKTYVPLRFLAEQLNIKVEWNQKKKQARMSRPFQYRDGKWYGAQGFWPWNTVGEYQPVSADNRQLWQAAGGYLVPLNVGADPTMSRICLYWLGNDGSSRFIRSGILDILDVKTEGSACYLLEMVSPAGVKTSITRVDIAAPASWQVLGEESFSYGTAVLMSAGEDRYSFRLAGPSWELRPDGIYALGYDYGPVRERFIDNNNEAAMRQVEQSYGYYLLEKTGHSHQLVKRQELPWEKAGQ